MSTSMPEVIAAVPPAVDACWNRIGVKGDKTCRHLEQHIHCRNCPIYSAAGRAVLDVRSPEESHKSWSSQLEVAPSGIDTRTHSVMTFRLGAEYFGLPVRSCKEVVEARFIHSLPHHPHAAVLGVANVRGVLLICISLSMVLRLPPGGGAQETREGSGSAAARLLVIESVTGPVAIPVDEVCGVSRYHPHDLKPVPTTLAKTGVSHSQGVLVLAQRSIGVLDVDRLSQTITRTLA